MDPSGERYNLPAYPSALLSRVSSFLCWLPGCHSYAQCPRLLRGAWGARCLGQTKALSCPGALQGQLLWDAVGLVLCPCGQRRKGTQILDLFIQVVAFRLQGPTQLLKALNLHLEPFQFFVPEGFLRGNKSVNFRISFWKETPEDGHWNEVLKTTQWDCLAPTGLAHPLTSADSTCEGILTGAVKEKSLFHCGPLPFGTYYRQR